MIEINLQLFSGGGAKSGLGGGRGGGDEVNSNAATYTFTYRDKNGNEHTISVRGDDLDEAKQNLIIMLRQKGIKQAKIVSYKKESSKQPKVASNVTKVSNSVSDNRSGEKIDLSDSPLSYTGEKTGLDKKQMGTIRKIANEIKDKTKENLTAFDKNGKAIYNTEGNATEVSTPANIARQESYDIHNHTRGNGLLGGTFSVVDTNGDGDMVGFTNRANKKAAFASAKEGIYYISKRDGFKAKEFMSHMREYETKAERQMSSSLSELKTRYNKGNMSNKTYRAAYNKIKNKYLVDMHNEYLRNQGKYGYDYGLLKH